MFNSTIQTHFHPWVSGSIYDLTRLVSAVGPSGNLLLANVVPPPSAFYSHVPVRSESCLFQPDVHAYLLVTGQRT
jgi:hypothetical protein